MKIIILQAGPDHEFFMISSLLIGLKRKYPQSSIWWMGEPKFFDILKYNNKINSLVDVNEEITLKSLQLVYGADLCINLCNNRKARNLASTVIAKTKLGFTKDNIENPESEFLEKILENKLQTNKTSLDIYYQAAQLNWKGEGYGITYFPKLKQTQEIAHYTKLQQDILLPTKITEQLDQINQFKHIITDDLFITYAAIALKKDVTITNANELNYKIETFS